MWHSFNYSFNNNYTNYPNNSEINNSDMSTGTFQNEMASNTGYATCGSLTAYYLIFECEGKYR